MLGDVINGIIGPVFDATWSSLKTQYHQGLSDTEQKQARIKADSAISQASQNYHQNYLQRHCNIKVLPGLMKEGMPLDKIYTAVKFLKDSDLRYFSTLDNLEELYREAGNRRFRVGGDERQDGLIAANNEQYLMVLGGPGVGKSTFLRKLGLEALENRLAHNLMPVFIELKSFKSEEMSLQHAIAKELEVSGFPYAENLVQSMLSDSKMLILLDGLDEVPSKQVDGVIKQIKDCCDLHQHNRFVTSCRVAAYQGGFNRFTDVTMAEFDDEQIEQFVQRWFSSDLDQDSETAKQFWELLKQTENASAKELAQTPLLLTFLCLVYDRSQSLPPVRSDLYGKALNILLEDWAAEKRIKQDPIYQGLHTGLEKELLSEIAYQSFKEDQLFFSEQEIIEQISTFLADTLDAPKHLDGANVLHAIEVQQGILVERATNAYSFSHLTLQEYLTASYISSEWSIQDLVSNHLTDNRWREVFLLVSGLAGRRSHELLLAMEQQVNGSLGSLKLQDLLQWVNKLSDETHVNNTQLISKMWLLASASTIASTIGTGTKARNLRDAREIAAALARASDIDIAVDIAVDIDSPRTIAREIASDSNRARIITNEDMARVGNISLSVVGVMNRVISRASTRARTIANAIAFVRTGAIDYDKLSKKLIDLKKYIHSNKAPIDKWKDFSHKWEGVAAQLVKTL